MAKAIPSALLRRERLFALLDGAGKAAWISGPPGSGKTTLVSTWVEARRLPFLWYRVQASDADPASLFYELAARAGRRRAPLPPFTPEYRGGEAAFARRFFRELAPRRRLPWALVLDDLNQVVPSQPLLAVLCEAIEELPPGSRVILVSREPPPAAFSRLIGNGVMSVLGGEHLRLTDVEALAIAQARAPGMPREELESACARAAGWAAGLVLLVTNPFVLRSSLESPALFQYLGTELLDRADPETRRILIDAAIPPVLPGGIVAALCDSDRALALFQELARRAYFVAPRRGEDSVFELHPLVREFLMERALSERPREQLRRLETRAAALFAEVGRLEDAVDLYARAEAWVDVVSFALALAPHLVATGRTARLEGWLEALPPALAERHPSLSYWHGVCRLLLDPSAARAHLARAWKGFEAAGDVTGLHLVFATAIDSFISQWADLHGMDQWIDRFQGIAHHPAAPNREAAWRSAIAMLAALTFRRLGSEALIEWEGRALETVGDAHLPPSTRLAMGSYLMVGCALRGEGLRAAEVVRTLAPLARVPGVDPVAALGWLTAEAVHFWNVGAPSESQRTADLGLEMARESGAHMWDFFFWQQRVLASLAAGDPERARQHMAAIEPSPNFHHPLRMASLHEMEALIALHEGDTPRAVSAARAMAKAASETGMPFTELLGSIYLTLALVEVGDAGARSQLEVVRRGAATFRSALAEMIAEMAQAELERRSGDLDSARDHLARGIRVGREKGIAPDIWFCRGRLADLCALALDSGIETEHVLGLVRRLALAAPAGYGSERWPWEVRVRLFGPIAVVAGGAPLKFKTKARRRPLDVFAAMIACGDRGRTAQAIAAMLWPESDGDLAHHALETATYRLRRLVGDDIVQHRQGELRFDTGRCWVDALAFETFLNRAAAFLQRRDLRGGLTAAEGAVALYRAPFLSDRVEPWVLATRERFRVHLRRCLSDLERLGADREAMRRLRADATTADPELRNPPRATAV